MIQTILTKVLQELGQENPKLDYIRGMVEVLLASQEKQEKVVLPNVVIDSNTLTPNYTPPKTEMTEADLMNSEAAAKLKVIKNLGTLE